MIGRLARPVVVATMAAFALGVALASPASAAITVTPPDQVRVKPGTVIIVQVPTPEGFVCETDWATAVDGKRSVVKSVSAVSCNAGVATWRVKVSQVKRGEAYVSFTATSAPMEMTNEDGSTYTMDPLTQTVDLTISLKGPKPKPSSTNANGCTTTTSTLCTAIGVT